MINMRRSTEDDLEQLAHLRLLFFAENYLFTEEETRTFEEKTTEFLTVHLNSTLISWHAEIEDEIVAVAFLEIAERLPHPDRKYGKIGTILNVYTKKGFRKQGIASQLVQRLVKEAEKHQLDKIELMATELGYPVYEKIGFKEVALLDKRMEKKLD
ncbi:GNAT family N-acetyltransferase [Enterococcus sp. BWM-S5]|uniref:GNAT family N-acetyltransferase n=1 Tax=Enterococcus larvae TaxID=2794352 RepID=A0ABS4CHR8_9ENTE|nr:GNAT family N-acetyltransferase [Enterococcus larvae]MBP1045656.1 GNAT family N-acetyltransferase [Enterococcus larvae]